MKLTAMSILKLLQLRGVGRSKIFKIHDLLEFAPSDINDWVDFLKEFSQRLNIASINRDETYDSFFKGEELYENSLAKGINVIGYWDENFPTKLREIPNPPALINVMGNFRSLNSLPGAAIIGTREPSNYGKSIGERLGYRFGENNINVISGLAKGCDTAAHVGCIKAGGITTAILAHGLDYIYPKENTGLAEKIIDTNGCLLSEYTIKVRAQPSFFVERDRLQSGLASATVVVETAIKGGTMHAVKSTLASKKILAVFNHPFEKRNDKSTGNEMLINDGKAVALQTKSDIDNLILRLNTSIENVSDKMQITNSEKVISSKEENTPTVVSLDQLEWESTLATINHQKNRKSPKKVSEAERLALEKYEECVKKESELKITLAEIKKEIAIATANKKILKEHLDSIRKTEKINKQPRLL